MISKDEAQKLAFDKIADSPTMLDVAARILSAAKDGEGFIVMDRDKYKDFDKTHVNYLKSFGYTVSWGEVSWTIKWMNI